MNKYFAEKYDSMHHLDVIEDNLPPYASSKSPMMKR